MPPYPQISPDVSLNAVGTLQPRPDSLEKVTGEANFTDDLRFDGMLHARVRRALVPHALVRRLDVEKARLLPGVVAYHRRRTPGEQYHGWWSKIGPAW
jgi:xanthine dehydrogenase molybdopterin-binding subunit B